MGIYFDINDRWETRLKLKFHDNSLFTLALFRSYPMVLKFCTEHGSDSTAVLCAKF